MRSDGDGKLRLDADAEAVFGIQWRALLTIWAQAASMDDVSAERVREATRKATTPDVLMETWHGARSASRANGGQEWDNVHVLLGGAPLDVVGPPAWAAVTWHLATRGPSAYTVAHRDLLIAPWVSVFGLPPGLVTESGSRSPQ